MASGGGSAKRRAVTMTEGDYRLLRRRLLTAMLVVPGLPFLLVLAVGYYYFSNSLQTEIISKMQVLVGDHKADIETFLRERTNDLKVVAESYDFDQLIEGGNLARVFDRLKRAEAGFMDLGVHDAAGVHRAYVGPFNLVGIVYAQEPWFQEVMTRQVHVSDVFLGFRKVPHFIIAVARKTDQGTWILRATVDSNVFDQTVERGLAGSTAEAYVVNRQGQIQTRKRSGGNLLEVDRDAAHYLAPHDHIRSFVGPGGDGRSYLYTTAWLKDRSWLLVVRQEEAEAFRGLTDATYLVLGISLLGGLLIFLAGVYATDRLIGQLRSTEAEKAQLTQQLIAAGRLAEIGEMSAGVAHEINNPLQIIRVEQVLMEDALAALEIFAPPQAAEDLDQLKDSLRQINVQVERCAAITHSLLKFARGQEQQACLVDLAGFVQEVVGLVQRQAAVQGVTMTVRAGPDLPRPEVDPNQLQQVLLNLLNNAVDAVVERHGLSGGQVTATVRPIPEGVEISVADNGVGISPANQDKIFSPFFTTKPVGKGTGLGLAVCYGIIGRMGGQINLTSQEGEGTTFTISLPARSPAEKNKGG